MAIRTDSSTVMVILDTDLTTTQVDAFIATASRWIDANLVGQGVSSTLLTEIETYLAAHFCCLRDPRLHTASAGDTSEDYTGRPVYLESAIALDPTGRVAGAFKARQKGRPVSWRVGTTFTDDIRYPS